MTQNPNVKKQGFDDLGAALISAHGIEAGIEKCFDLLNSAKRFEPSKFNLINGLTVNYEKAGRSTTVTVARDNEILAVDSFTLEKAKDRNNFIDALDLSDDERNQVDSILKFITTLPAEQVAEIPTGETVQTSFRILEDGRAIEQIFGNRFGVYDPETKEHCILESVTDLGGIKYEPIDDELFQKPGGVQIANDLTEYGTEKELIREIENYLSAYLDLKPLFLKLTALYILFTYIFDTVLELSYLNATGDPGSGKSRFGSTVCFASRRGLAMITPSAASLYRIVDKFSPTIFVDEFNSEANSDDSAAVIQILNAGYQKTAQIPRQVALGDGRFRTEMFDPYCPKIIGSLKQSNSNAFNSRCIQIQMERTTRNDIPLRLSRKHLQDAQNLRNKLTLWRLRNIQNDFEAKLDRAAAELQKSGIVPRSIQINIPLFALINDDELKTEFINLLRGRDAILSEEKSLSLDGQIMDKIHTLLFESYEDEGSGEIVTTLNERNFDKPPEPNEICEALLIERLLGMMNAGRQKEIAAQSFGKMIIELGLFTKQILCRSSQHRRKRAIVFDYERLGYLFKIHNLPVSKEFNVTNVTKTRKTNDDKGLEVVTLNETNPEQEKVCDQAKRENKSTYESGHIGHIENAGKDENEEIGEYLEI